MNSESVAGVDRAHHGGASDSDVIDFSANVNPELPAGVETVYGDALDASRRYPDDGYDGFRQAAAECIGCSPADVIPTAGGLAALRLALGTVVDPGDRVLLPAPGFAEYDREVRLQGGTPEPRPQGEIVDATAGDLAEATAAIVCTPNNPTGALPERSDLLDLAARCRESDTTLLVDEAFLGFTEQASLSGTAGTIVLRSLTKLYGLPGLRAGYAIATGRRREALATARQAWSLGTPAAMVGEHVLGDEAFVEQTRKRVQSERRRLHDRLSTAYDVSPSAAPFLLVDLGEGSVDDLLDRCRSAGVVLRDARTFTGLDRHVRIAIRRPEEHDRLLAAMGVCADA